ncbi:aspartate aminotransferase family protein [Deinococcus yavapaiensis]|uniref:aminotransferase family protein n=1 Tax=Deinococcus yavapaiensis TaxID=309889 RepID=UPI000DA12B33|nr:aminotransferase class III-fold pyridoxal phosphate-dependent enzyme [Deinococcus yavapaiensis]
MSSVFYRSVKHYPTAVRGEGVYLFDAAGRKYLDGASGALVANIGHGNASVADAMAAQARTLAFVHGSQFTSEVFERYASRLADLLPFPGYRFWACSGGSEAIESAVKLARQYHAERGDTKRFKIVTRRPSYHGASLGALAASGMGARRELYLPLMNDDAFPKMPKPDAALNGDEDARRLEAVLHEAGPETVAAFIAEPIVGASDAALVPSAGYYEEVQRICREHGVLFVADEVMSGMGRAGTTFAISQWNARPDILVLGKGLAAGYAPLAGLLASPDVYGAVMQGSGAFKHGFTYAGHPVSLAAGEAVLDVIEEQRLVENARERGAQLLAGLHDLRAEFPQLLQARGRGLMLGLVLGDPESGQAYDTPGLADRLATAAFTRGLVTYPGSGAVDGRRGDHVLLGPPLTITAQEVDEMLGLLRLACRDALTTSVVAR